MMTQPSQRVKLKTQRKKAVRKTKMKIPLTLLKIKRKRKRKVNDENVKRSTHTPAGKENVKIRVKSSIREDLKKIENIQRLD